MNPSGDQRPDRIDGRVARVTFRNPENGFTVLRLEQEGGGRVAVVGNLPELKDGQPVRLFGRWTQHPRYGQQFEADAVEVVEPTGAEAIERYLASGAIPGVGPVLARRLVERFGARTLEVIEEAPRRLTEVEGVGREKARRIHRGLKDQKDAREAFLFLQGHGVGPALAARIHQTYGERTVARIQEDPYRLIYDVRGVGFLTADRIARSLGIPVDGPQRARALIRHRLQEATLAGHTFLPRPDLQREVVQEGIPPERFEEALAAAAERDEVVQEPGEVDAVYLPYLYEAELEVCLRLRLLLSSPSPEGEREPAMASGREQDGEPGPEAPRRGAQRVDPARLSQEVALAERSSRLELAPEQREALVQALVQPVLIITGGPGTGKTTLARAVAAWCQARQVRLLLASPTGRASRRLREATGLPARTLHRTLEFTYVPGAGERAGARWVRNAGNPLDADVVLVDELSMVDLPLFARLLAAVRPPTRLILIGDADQLPSVGPGQVLRDLLESGVVPSFRLRQIFRQAEQSLIVQNAHRIRTGRRPVWNRPGGEFFFIPAEPEAIPALVTDLVSRRLPSFAPDLTPAQIQVLCATRRGPSGADGLNRSLQEALNPAHPGKAEVTGGTTPEGEPERFRVGDRVMQVRNDYEKMVFNGELGRVAAVDPEQEQVTVVFDEGEESQEVLYGPGELDELQLAYATSVHKSQGSEYPAVVMPVVSVMPALMSRNLLYTAITRARRLVVLVGQVDALERYCRSSGALLARHSRMARRLVDVLGQGSPRIRPVQALRPALEALWRERHLAAPLEALWVDPERQRPSALCYVEREGRYLMIRRTKEPFAGLWTAPGGKVEPGESPEEAIRREVREETGLELERLELRMITSETGPHPAYNWLLFVFQGTAAPGPERDGGEGALRWFDRAELERASLPDVDRRLLPYLLAGPGAPLHLARVRYDAGGGVAELEVEEAGRTAPAAGETRE
ncbi:AAA family ATPase [Limnochorda pilosa]|uniref:ATP-dependent RecD2 DNA helicase n=1 Tax=Limnochorda pilosa TaxID=1555112 RepID=A0A0K2SPQ4_LIMPI|nr:ATP-dependent RecD-like DNA helicase [Limnochorda pilosa]BAS28804.1 helicase [Limnochorda pilosa]